MQCILIIFISTPLPNSSTGYLCGVSHTPQNPLHALFFLSNLLSPISIFHINMNTGQSTSLPETTPKKKKKPKKHDPCCSSNHLLSRAPQLGVGLMSLSSLHAGKTTGLILCFSCADNHRCCQFLSVVVLSCLGTSIIAQFKETINYTLKTANIKRF